MESYFNQFNTSIRTLFSEMNEFVPTSGISKFFELIDNPDFDHSKLIGMVHFALEDKEDLLKNKDEQLFENQIKLFPGVYVNKLWSKLNDEQKTRIFLLLTHTYVLVELMWQETKKEPMGNSKRNTINSMMTYLKNEKMTVSKEFNVYEGIQTDSTEGFGIDDMFSGPDVLPNKNDDNDSLLNMLPSADIDLNQLRDQLVNMKKEDIEEATKNIKKMMGGEMNEETSSMIENMLSEITGEIQTTNFNDSNPFEAVQKIAESVAGKMKGKVNDSNLKNLLNTTGNLAQNVKDENGKKLFNPAMMGMLNGMMSGKMPKNMPKSREMDMKAAQQMMNQMGLGNLGKNKNGKRRK
tara:strand:- start:7401 stop:8453 length:1053 start_codon:yes stop_codon:yes gene_type:complete